MPKPAKAGANPPETKLPPVSVPPLGDPTMAKEGELIQSCAGIVDMLTLGTGLTTMAILPESKQFADE